MLPNSKIVRSVLLDEGLLEAITPGTLLLDMSSSAPTDTREISATIAEAGVHFVDAPVSGGVRGARAGSLTIVGGVRKGTSRPPARCWRSSAPVRCTSATSAPVTRSRR